MMFDFLERKIFEKCLADSEFFEKIGRPLAYFFNGNDPEKVHERALELLNKYLDVVEKISPDFDFPNLHVDIAGKSVMPFGNAEGLETKLNERGYKTLEEFQKSIPYNSAR